MLTQYARGCWKNPEEPGPLTLPGKGVFVLPGPAPRRTVSWSLHPARPLDGPVPVPPGLYRLEAQIPELQLNRFDVPTARLRQEYHGTGTGEPGHGRSPQAPPPGSPLYLQVPQDLRPVLERKAQEVLGPEPRPPDQSARLLQEHLCGGYRYELGVRRNRKLDPLVDFLMNSRAGHCEFFASSLALLLRVRGIPTRYVLGYLVMENNPTGGYFIVRDRDAHAWVEVYQPDRGWVEYDPTPPAELLATYGEDPQTGLLGGLWDSLIHHGGKAWSSLKAKDWRVLSQLAGALAPWMVVPLLAVAAARAARRWSHRRRPNPPEPLLLARDRLFSRLGAQGWRRLETETVLEYARRVAPGRPEAAAWLARYNRARFGGAEAAELKELLETVP